MESIHANCPCMETCPLNRARVDRRQMEDADSLFAA